MSQYETMARRAYRDDEESKLKKAIAAGRAMDNALKVEYGKGGTTRSHFMMDNYLKYFDYEALGKERILLLLKNNL